MNKIVKQEAENIVTLHFGVSNEELDNIMCGCLEGGSSYWIKKVSVKDNKRFGAEFTSEVVSRGGKLLIKENDRERTTYELGKRELLLGITRYGNEQHELDFDNMDAGRYDMILQYALFGELIYG